MPIKHKFITPVLDDLNAKASGLVISSDWNDEHDVALDVAEVSGAYPSSNPAGYVDLATAALSAPVQSVAGKTGAVALAVADVSGAYPSANPAGYVNAIDAAAAAPVQSVAGKTGAVALAVADVSGAYSTANPAGYVNAAAAGAAAPVQSVAGKIGTVTLAVADVSGAYPSANPAGYITAAGVPVQSVAGKTGVVTLAVADIAGAYPSANPTGYVDAAGAAVAAPVQSVAGKTGAVSLVVGDVSGAYASSNPAAYVNAAGAAAAAPVQSVNGKTGVVAITAADFAQGTTGTGAIVLANSPTLTGTPSLPTGTIATTQTRGANSTAPATTAYVDKVAGTAGGQNNRNKFYNGSFALDQRNDGALVTGFSSTGYNLDTWKDASTPSVASIGRQFEDNFYQYFRRITTAFNPLNPTNPNNLSYLETFIEVNDLGDLFWGSANARSITISFDVRSSRSGNWSFIVCNARATRRCYVTQYNIPVPNVYTPITITIPADSLGIGNGENSAGLLFRWGFGAGSNFSTASNINAWAEGDFYWNSNSFPLTTYLNETWNMRRLNFDIGTVATEFSGDNPSINANKVRRYYEAGTYTQQVDAKAEPFKITLRYNAPKRVLANAVVNATAGSITSVSQVDKNTMLLEGTTTAAGDISFTWSASSEP